MLRAKFFTSSTARTTTAAISSLQLICNLKNFSTSSSFSYKCSSTSSCSCSCCPSSTSSGAPTTPNLITPLRRQGGGPGGMTMSAFGSMVPFQGYISSDLVAAPVPGGGQHKRGVVTQSDLPFDREIMRVPAYLLHVGEQKPRKMIPFLVKTCLKRFVDDRRHASYISKRLFTMMVGGNPIFRSEEEVKELMYDVEGANLLITKGLISTLDIHRLGCALYFNRFECEYKGQQGMAIFPEVSFFNHSCEPNVKLEFFWDNETGDYVCSARTIKPVHGGDQLVIHYFPNDVDLPLSRFQRKLQDRWSFTCLCPTCRTRTVLATLVAGAFMMAFFFVPLAVYSVWQRKEKLVEAGMA